VQLARDLETHSLRLLLRHPEALYMVDRALQGANLSRLDITDFDHAEHQALVKLILQSLDQDEMEPSHYIQEKMPEAFEELAQALLQPLAQGEPTSDQLEADLIRTIIRLRLVRVTDTLNQLRYMQEEMQQQGDLSLGPYQDSFSQYQQIRNYLDRALVRPLHLE
jgi:DNA primase